MAQVDISLTFSQLLALASELGIPLDLTKKLQKWDLVKALRNHSFEKGTCPTALLPIYSSIKPFFDELSSPQLCYPYELLDPVSKREVMNSSEWVAEEKLNGFRALLSYIDGKVTLWSRTTDCVTFFPVVLSNIRIGNMNAFSGLPSFILDGELLPSSIPQGFHNKIDYLSYILDIEREASLKFQREHPVLFYPFDALLYDGSSITNLPLLERAKLLESILVRLEKKSPSIGRVPRALEKKTQFLDKMFRSGSEGIVVKNLYAPYNPFGQRRKDSYVKVKRSYFMDGEVLFLQDTFDGWISNTFSDESGEVTSIEVSTYLRNEDTLTIHTLAKVPLPSYQRLPFLRFSEGKIHYESLLGTVVEVDGKGFSDELTLNNPILLRFRTDKTMSSCILEYTDIQDRINNKEVTT